MKKLLLGTLTLGFLTCIALSCSEENGCPKSKPPLLLSFDQPAGEWTEAIPIGNGRLGGMVFGGVSQEKIQTNDDTFWSGEPRDLQRLGTYTCLPEIRQLLLEEKNREAQQLINEHMLGEWNQNYMPLADILLNLPHQDVTDYKRELDLNRGLITISYRQDGIEYTREIFCSFPDQAIVMRLSADKKKMLCFTARLESAVRHTTRTEGNEVIIRGQAPRHIEPEYQGIHDPVYEEGHGMRFEGRLIIDVADGKIVSAEEGLTVEDASEATLYFVAATSYNGFDKDPFKEGKDEKRSVRIIAGL